MQSMSMLCSQNVWSNLCDFILFLNIFQSEKKLYIYIYMLVVLVLGFSAFHIG